MQGPIRCALIAGMLYGCDTGQMNPPAADAPVGPSGLSVEWSSSPSSWPNTKDGVTIEKARFALDSLRVVGDAGPGDPRTTVSTLELGFAWSDSDQRPGAIIFDDAPPGLYSQVALAFDGRDNYDSYEIRGRVLVETEEKEFRIEDSGPLAFNVPISEELQAGEATMIRLRINFTHALESVDWSNVDTSDGRLELENGDSQMTAFRTKLIESFEIDEISSGAR